MREALKVLKSGLLTTLQDSGRHGYLSMGISPAGSMDPHALRTANALVGNSADAAVLEITYLGPELLVLEDLTLALAGADLTPMLDGRAIPMSWAMTVKKDSILSFGARRRGCRLILAVAGGFSAPPIFGSRSTDVRCGLGPPPLRPGDILYQNETGAAPAEAATVPSGDIYEPRGVLKIGIGPEITTFAPHAIDQLLASTYTVTSHADRTGIRLNGPPVAWAESREMRSTAMLWGNIQVPPGGQPIILGPEHQSVGGYPRIGYVIKSDFPKLAQLFMNDPVRFQLADAP